MSELHAVRLTVFVALMIFLSGIYLSFRYNAHWLNRAGAAIVCSEALIALIERRMANRFRRIQESRRDNRFIEEEIERYESRVFRYATFLAIFGEFLHGFGDVIFEKIVGSQGIEHHSALITMSILPALFTG